MNTDTTESPSVKSKLVIFLDIDGVINSPVTREQINKKVDELYPELETIYDKRIQVIAMSHLFNKTALNNLDNLINKIEKIAKVSIVISSNWRLNRSVEELSQDTFVMHNFSKYIIDKTPEKLSEEEISTYCIDKSHSETPFQCRAAEIKHWLHEHSEVDNYVILDDIDSHLSQHFDKKYYKILCEKLLTSDNIEQILKDLNEQLKITQ